MPRVEPVPEGLGLPLLASTALTTKSLAGSTQSGAEESIFWASICGANLAKHCKILSDLKCRF